MPNLNSVTLLGNLTADPELKSTPAGDAVASFTVAVNSKTKSGEQRCDFFDCSCFGGWAENFCKAAKKGTLTLVEGRLRQEQWTDSKTNGKRSRVKIVAQRVFALEAKRGPGADDEPPVREAGEDDLPY